MTRQSRVFKDVRALAEFDARVAALDKADTTGKPVTVVHTNDRGFVSIDALAAGDLKPGTRATPIVTILPADYFRPT